MANRLVRFELLLALTTLLSIIHLAAPGAARAWGAVFTDAARDQALAQLSFELELAPDPASPSLPPEWFEPRGSMDMGAATEQAVEELTWSLSRGDPLEVSRALAKLTSVATDLWQPLSAAGLVDAPGTAPGFNFRYEVLLAQAAAESYVPERRAAPIAGVASHARSVASERALVVDRLALADARARAASGGLYDEGYYAVLRQDLGPDLEAAFRGASDTLADLIETAWERSGRPAAGGEAPSLELTSAAFVDGQVSLRFFLSSPQPVTAAVYNLTGRRVGSLHDGPLTAGFHHLSVSLGGSRPLPSGIYFLRLSAGMRVATAKLGVVR
jgi:hypothetical protein